MAYNLIKWVKGDTRPVPQFTIEKSGSAVNIAAPIVVKFKIYAKGSSTQLNSGHDTCTHIVDANGTCYYSPLAADTATAGQYEGDLVVYYSLTDIQTVYDKLPIEIIESTGAAFLCSISEVEAEVGFSFTSTSKPTADQVSNWIAQASQRVEEYTGRKYSEVTVTSEVHDGDGTTLIMLDHYPITSITTLIVDSTTLAENTSFWVRDATAGVIEVLTPTLELLEGDAQGHRSVSCTYKHGITAIPSAIREFAAVTVALRVVGAAGLAKTDGGALKSYSDGDVSLSYSDSDRATAALVARYNELKTIVPRKLGMATGSL